MPNHLPELIPSPDPDNDQSIETQVDDGIHPPVAEGAVTLAELMSELKIVSNDVKQIKTSITTTHTSNQLG